MYQIDDFCDTIDHSVKVFKDRKGGKSEVRVKNPGRKVMKVFSCEDCVNDFHNTSGGEKPKCCDNIMQVSGDCYFIELKGEGLQAAIRQISKSIELFSELIGCNKVIPVVSGTKVRTPAIAGAQKEYEKFKSKFPNLTIGPFMKGSSGVEIDL